MALEAIFEIGDLNYIYFHVFPASNGLQQLNERRRIMIHWLRSRYRSIAPLVTNREELLPTAQTLAALFVHQGAADVQSAEPVAVIEGEPEKWQLINWTGKPEGSSCTHHSQPVVSLQVPRQSFVEAIPWEQVTFSVTLLTGWHYDYVAGMSDAEFRNW